jgi:hypothetical protein
MNAATSSPAAAERTFSFEEEIEARRAVGQNVPNFRLQIAPAAAVLGCLLLADERTPASVL